MTALTLRFVAKSSQRFDLSALTPDGLKGLSARQIEALKVGTTRDPATVGDVFKLKGDDPSKLRFIGKTDVNRRKRSSRRSRSPRFFASQAYWYVTLSRNSNCSQA